MNEAQEGHKTHGARAFPPSHQPQTLNTFKPKTATKGGGIGSNGKEKTTTNQRTNEEKKIEEKTRRNSWLDNESQ